MWANAIGVLPTDELRGFPLIMSLHATGWAGLAAIRLAPNLSSLPFRSLCLFLIFAGLVHCVLLASWLTHPVKSWVTGLKTTLNELKDLGPVPNEAAVSKPAEGGMQNRGQLAVSCSQIFLSPPTRRRMATAQRVRWARWKARRRNSAQRQEGVPSRCIAVKTTRALHAFPDGRVACWSRFENDLKGFGVTSEQIAQFRLGFFIPRRFQAS